jgi:hypothetical protein
LQIPIPKPVSFLCLALCCTVIAFPVVSEWCQTVSGIRALALARFLAAFSDLRHSKQAMLCHRSD